jgi:hypothetical protein
MVELTSGMLLQLLNDDAQGQCLSIRSIRKHRVDGVTRHNDLRADGDFVTQETIRIPRPILSLVMVAHDSDDFLGHRGQVTQELLAASHV